MARIEYIPWQPMLVRYRIEVAVRGFVISAHAATQRAARRKARKLDEMADKYREWETQ